MAKKKKMVLCRNCKNTMPKGTKNCPACGAKNKKPFYKKWWFVFIVIIAIIGIINSIGGGKKTEKIDWEDIVLGDMIPKPKASKGNIIINSDTRLDMDLVKVSKSDYREYVSECEEMGYVVEIDKSSNMYDAYNEEGYKLHLWYMDSQEELNIDLDAPMEMGELKWPSSDLAKLLPIPTSTIGKISRESSEGFYIWVGDTSLDDYAAYVEECSAAGFNVDYDKGDKFYHAYDAAGNYVSINYTGNNVINIELSKAEETEEAVETSKQEEVAEAAETPKQEEVAEAAETSKQEEAAEAETDTSSELIDGMRPEFKESMDKYEEFMNEYCAFMKKYTESDGTDLGLLADYAVYMAKYADMMGSFEDWEDDEMNDAETAYYIKVQTRVNQKLLEVGTE